MSAGTPAPANRWLYGPAPDLLVGCGLWYALAFALLALSGEAIRTGGGMTLVPLVSLFFGTPHYGATLLRVYERRADRRKYTVFAVYATLLLFVAFAAGVHSAIIGSWILTIYITWSPWHYTGQNYGIAVMFLRRRGVSLDPGLKRLVYASFLLSYVMTFLAVHGGEPGSDYAPLSYEADRIRFIALGLPAALTGPAIALCALAYVGALGAAGVRLLRRATLRDIAPAVALAGTQALWFSIPLLMRHWSVDTGIEPWTSTAGTYYFLWIAIGHSAQYLWITSYYARSEGWTGGGRYYAKVMLAGAAIWTLPALLFAPGGLGRLPYDAGLASLVASVVNLHHFVLDGAIWKLRDGRVARVLLRQHPPPGAAPIEPGRSGPGLAPLVYAVGAACLLVMVGDRWERFGMRRAVADGDLPRVQRAVERLAWIGRDSAALRVPLGQALESAGDRRAALREFSRALELDPSANAWSAIGGLHRRSGRWGEAVTAYESAVAIDPDAELAYYGLGIAELKLGRPERAREAFARAAALNPERRINQEMLERAERAMREAAGPAAEPPPTPEGDAAARPAPRPVS